MSGDATVWAQDLEGRWQRMGADRVRGVWPEGLRAAANDWGPDTCSLLVRRDPGAVYPDVLPFTPIDVEIDGQLDWSGFVWEPPQQADERAIALECRGWQYHADDDLLDRFYVHSRLESWIDQRSLLGANLAQFGELGRVNTGDGIITIGYELGTTVPADYSVGVTLDLGAGNLAKRVVVEFDTVNASAAFTLFGRTHDGQDPRSGSSSDAFSVALNAGSPQSGTFSTARRYVSVFLTNSVQQGPLTGDVVCRIRAIRVFRDTAYESGGVSILKASDVVKDLLPFCPLLDQRTDLIQTSTVALPHFSLEEQTPRQGMEQANAVEGWQLRVTPERMLEYRPRPTVPILRTGGWARDALSGASRGSGEPIHNRAVVKGNDSSGGQVVVERYAGQQVGTPGELIAGFSNPGFEIDASGWTPTSSSITRITSTTHSGAGAGSWDSASALNPGDALETTLSGTFVKGAVYRVSFWLRTVAGIFPKPDQQFGGTMFLGTATDQVSAYVRGVTTTWALYQLVWVPKVTANSGVKLSFLITALDSQNGPLLFDDFALEIVRPTVPDRRGFLRSRAIRVERPIDFDLATALADASLRQAMRTPFKGDVSAAPTVVRTFLGDAAVHPGQLLRHAGELLHHGHLIDPDAGSLGRDARVVAVAYEDETRVANVSLDNTRGDFETQLARYEVAGRR